MFKGLLEFAQDVIVIINGEGGIVVINAQAQKLSCCSREELLGKPV